MVAVVVVVDRVIDAVDGVVVDVVDAADDGCHTASRWSRSALVTLRRPPLYRLQLLETR